MPTLWSLEPLIIKVLLFAGHSRVPQGTAMSRMQDTRGDKGGGASSECAPHENPRGYEEFSPAEDTHRTTNIQEWAFAGKHHIIYFR